MPNDTYKKLFAAIRIETAPSDLEVRIFGRVNKAILVSARIRGFAYSLCTCVAVVACILAVRMTAISMDGSGFTSYVSILASDGATILGLWKEFGMALVESFPILGGSAVVALALASIYSMSKSLFYIKKIRSAWTAV